MPKAKTPKKETPPPLERLSPKEEAILKASKEIAVKFIETGRLSANAFGDTFAAIHKAIKDTVDGKKPAKAKKD